jgi:nucleotide-binding universal stress UspA family protein
MKSIVVGFDGSESSLTTLDWVAQRAVRGDCRVEIVMVHSAILVADDEEELVFEDAAARVRDVAPDAEVTARIAVGRTPRTLIEAAAQADLLVIGIHRQHPIRSALTGWRSLRLAAHSDVPTVLVPDDWEPVDGDVLVGVDDDDSSRSAVELAAREAVAAGRSLVLLHAWLMPVPSLEGPSALVAPHFENRKIHADVLAAAREVVARAFPALDVRSVLVEDNPASALLAEAKLSSLLVIGTHHRGIMEGAFIGSVGQDVLVEAVPPVCVVPLTRKSDQTGAGRTTSA